MDGRHAETITRTKCTDGQSDRQTYSHTDRETDGEHEHEGQFKVGHVSYERNGRWNKKKEKATLFKQTLTQW